jgi:hypothetical protein
MDHQNSSSETPVASTISPFDDNTLGKSTPEDTKVIIQAVSTEENYEVSKHPPTPKLATKAPNYSRLVPSSVRQRSFRRYSPKMTLQSQKPQPKSKPIQAHEPKCALCLTDFTSESYHARVEHFPQCWKTLHSRVVPSKTPTMTSQLLSIDEESSTTETDTDPEDFESYGSITPPARIQPKDTPPTSCVLCATSLSHLDDITAFNHRLCCLNTVRPIFCPICTQLFLSGGELWDKVAMLWHLHNCQHGGSLGAIDKDNFDVLKAAWGGRQYVLENMLLRNFGKRGSWRPQDHSNNYRTKVKLGYMVGGEEMYAVDPTPLRAVATNLLDAGMEESKVVRNEQLDAISMEKFRRSKFAVLGSSGTKEMPEEFKAEVVEVWHIPAVEDDMQLTTAALELIVSPEAPSRRPTSPSNTDNPSTKSESNGLTIIPRIPPGFHFQTTSSEDLDAILEVPTRPSSPINIECLLDAQLDFASINLQGYENAILEDPDLLDAVVYEGTDSVIPEPDLCRMQNSCNTVQLNEADNDEDDSADTFQDASVSRKTAPLSVATVPRARPNFTCADEVNEYVEFETYDYAPRGTLPVSLRSGIFTQLDPHMSWKEQSRRNIALCVFGGVEAMNDE